ncbi:hypothetical protein Hypma_007174 [Hypsizygus marmoreus]|uniref:Uncharacterized protein n=1 Tax=Hypsizygus marmoreus TaxID=39966 RepID=A0A369KBM8_HYPMA|nr:hypothetical protein Hypma_007174 [Hypsizygus marmoreus]
MLAVGPVVLWILIDMIMMLRISALYASSKKIMYPLVSAWLIAVAVIITVTIYSVRSTHVIPSPSSIAPLVGCFMTDLDLSNFRFAKGGVVAFMVLNAVGVNRFGSILSIFVRDGIIYFLMSMVAKAPETVFISGGLNLLSYADISQMWISAFYIYAGCHLILHLRVRASTDRSATGFLDSGNSVSRGDPQIAWLLGEHPRAALLDHFRPLKHEAPSESVIPLWTAMIATSS